jgi:hypothetical protein
VWLGRASIAGGLLLAGYCVLKALPGLSIREEPPQGRPAAATVGQAAQLRPIETIRLGERVLGRNPQGVAAEPEPDPATWRQVDLELRKGGGRMLYAGLLRGPAWLEAHKPEAGSKLWLDMPEMGAVGWATVTTVKPCPPIQPPPGQVVTGTFKHEPDDSILDVRLEGLAEPIGVTDTHPFWSEDRQAFVPVGKLRPGEHVRTETRGVVAVTSITHRPREAWVYNLEVHGEHVYEVSQLGLLVHNANSAPSKAAINKATKLLTQYDRLVQKSGGKISAKKLAQLDAKRAAGTITSRDLPGSLQAEFPGELAGKTLDEIKNLPR